MNTQITLHNPAQAHQVLTKLWDGIKNELIAGHKQVVEIHSYADALSSQQRKFIHGVIYVEIAKQAVIDGKKYAMPVWKEFFRAMFLGENIITVINPLTGAEKREVVRVSSETLTVKQYSELIDKVCAYSTTELNVNFSQDFDTWIADNEKTI